MKRFFKCLPLLLGLTSLAFGQTKGGVTPLPQAITATTSTSATVLPIANDAAGTVASFEYIITGTPTTISVVLKGCAKSNTCDTLETYSTVANSIRKPTMTNPYAYFTVTPTWTGGTSPTFTVNALISTVSTGGGAGGGGGSVTSVFGRTGVVTSATADYTASQVINAFDLSTNNLIGAHYFDFSPIANPGNPSAGNCRAYQDNGTGLISFLTSAGASCVSGGGGGAVTSVFGRTGVVVAATNDYNFTQISGSLAHAQLPTLLTGDIPNNAANTTGSAAKWTTARNLAGNSTDGSAAVPFTNKFLVQGTSDAGLTGAQFMGALGTGLVKNTTTTGVQSIAAASDVVSLLQGLTGCNTATFVFTPQASDCVAPGGGGSGTVNSGTIHAFAFYPASSAAVSSGPTPPAVNGQYLCGYTVSASAAVDPTCPLVGFKGRAVTGTTATDTILYSDAGFPVNYQGSVAVAVTLPTGTTLGNSNFGTILDNNTSGSSTAVTVTPTTWTVNGSSSLAIAQGQSCKFYADASGTNWDADCHDLPFVAGSNITITRGQFGPTIAAAASGTGLSGMGAGEIPVAATATTVTSSKQLNGTDAKIQTGTGVFTTSNMACGDANGGVTNCTALPNGMTGATQTAADNSTKVATTAYVDTGLAGKAASNASTTVNEQTCTLGSFCTIPLSATNPQTATYQVLAADFSNYKTILVASGTFTITLVASGAQPADGQYINILNYGSGVVTVARSGQNINGVAGNLTLNAGSATAPTSATISSNGTNYFAAIDEGTVGTVTQIAATAPLGGGPINGSGTVTCTTCATSTNGGAIPFDKSGSGLINPTADATFTQPNTSTSGWTLNGTAPASVSTATGTDASSILNVMAPTGGADSNITGTAGVGGSPAVTAGNGGAGTGTNSVGGAGGGISLTAGNGGASLGTGANANGGSVTLTPGTAGTGGSGTAGKAGVVGIAGAKAGFVGFTQGSANTTANTNIPANTIIDQAPTAVTAYAVTRPVAASTGIQQNVNSSAVITQSYSGDASHAVSQTAKTAAVTTFTVCAATAGTACGQAGQYRLTYNVWGSGTACSSVTAGSTVLNFTWTDENAVAHTTINAPMWDQKTAAMTSGQVNFNTALGTEGGSGSFIISTNGTIIQAATTYTACTTGTGTYNLRITAEQLQ